MSEEVKIKQDSLEEHIKLLVKQYGCKRAALLPILRGIMDKYHHISESAMQLIADHLQIHAIEVQDTASFYSFLGTKAKGKYIIRLCQTVACKMSKANGVARQLENELGIKFGETTPDNMFTLEWTNCLGMCDQGPALLVNDKMYTRVTADQVGNIIAKYRNQFVVDGE